MEWNIAQEVEVLLSKYEAIGTVLNTTHKKNNPEVINNIGVNFSVL
jgi:hypothetical protein